MSHVGVSFFTAESVLNINSLGAYRVLDILKENCSRVQVLSGVIK